MPTYKLTYFNATALGECIRFLLSYGGAEFEDVRIDFEKWPEMKSKMPMGQMPVLEIDGKPTHQSMAICRYLANEYHVAGNDNWEKLQVDMAAYTIDDFRAKIAGVHYERNETAKADKHKVLVNEQIPFYLGKLDAIAKANNGHFALGRLTWADMLFVGLLDYMNVMAKTDLIADYPNLLAVKKNVLANEKIKKWVDNRPKSPL